MQKYDVVLKQRLFSLCDQLLVKVRLATIRSYSVTYGNNIDECRLDHQWILHPSGKKIYRPRPSASVCKFSPPWDVKSIDDLASIRQ